MVFHAIMGDHDAVGASIVGVVRVLRSSRTTQINERKTMRRITMIAALSCHGLGSGRLQ